jgi:hypothetical protein
MKKSVTLSLLALGMGLMATSCSSDDDLSVNNESTTGAESFISVSIHDVADVATRATVDEGYAYGTEAERQVNQADFYFFDDNGYFMQQATLFGNGATMPGTASESTADAADGNIEFEGTAVIKLHDISAAKKPTQMVTVLNPSTALHNTKFATLSQLLEAVEEDTQSAQANQGNGFTMTTSTYLSTDGVVNVTPLVADNFKETEEAAKNATTSDGRITVYVERLAAKVQVSVDETAATGDDALVKGNADMTYKIGDYTVYDLNDEGQMTGTTTTLYAKFTGWGLNATLPESYLMKHIDASWTDNNLFTGWNNAGDFRCFWAKSPNYGLTTGIEYPSKYDVANTNKTTTLRFIPQTSLTTTLGLKVTGTTTDPGTLYCNENTNTGAILRDNNLDATATSVLVGATLVDADGNPQQDLIKYMGDFYTKKAYIHTVFRSLKGSLPYTHDNGAELNEDDLIIADHSILNGRVVVKYDAEAMEYTWDSYEGAEVKDIPESINNILAGFNEESDAIGYKDGLMYYSIPIEHLNNTANVVSSNKITHISEGHYGVVRNHWYKLAVTSLKAPGTGVWNPDEPIVPNPKDEQEYYLGVSINILAWKILHQNVTLQ